MNPPMPHEINTMDMFSTDPDPMMAPSLDLSGVPHLLESILAHAIRLVPRPILFASAPHIASYLNVASRNYAGVAPTHTAIYRMPWVDSGLAARLGDVWLLQELDKLSKSSDWSRRRPLEYKPHKIAQDVGASGNLDAVQYLVQSGWLGSSVPGVLIQEASMHGHLHILEWIAQHDPQAFQSMISTAHLGATGPEQLRVLQWWMKHQDVWSSASWAKTSHDWQLGVLVNACKEKRMDVVEYWLSVHDGKLIDSSHEANKHMHEHLAWPLAAAVYTGDQAFFDKVHALWPDAMDGTVLAFACGSGNLDLARHCHSLLVASTNEDAKVISKPAMDLCYLLATAVGGQDEHVALATLSWLHTDLQFPVTGHYTITSSWIRHILPADWPGAWDDRVTFHSCMDVATRLASTALLDWWSVHAKAVRGPFLTFFDKPLLAAAVSIRKTDPTPVLQWWIDSGLIPVLWPGTSGDSNLVQRVIEDGGRLEALDWILDQQAALAAQREGRPDAGHQQDLFPKWIMTLACRAGRVNVLEWIVKNEAKLPAPVFATSTFDFAFSHGHVKVLQWLADHGFVERMREMDKTRDLGGRASFEYRTISFVPEKWPECFECLEWSWANGFKMSKSMRKRVKAKVRYSSVGTLYLYLIQRKRPWGA